MKKIKGNMLKNTKNIDLILFFCSQFPLTRINFMLRNLTRAVIRVNFMLSKRIFSRKTLTSCTLNP